MKISIVTISFNQKKYLKDCIESILFQNYPYLEYIVVDPGSTDGSRELIESYGNKIVKVFEPDKGAADGLNNGFARATGDIFGFINSDDVLASNALNNIAASFSMFDADVVCGEGKFIDDHGGDIAPIIPTRFTPRLYIYGAVTLFQQGTFFKSAAFRKVSGFNPINKTNWDAELFVDMAMSGCKFKYIKHNLASFRLHSQSITVSGKLTAERKIDNDRIFFKVVNRKRAPLDLLIEKLYIPLKFILNPTYIFRRGFGKLMRF